LDLTTFLEELSTLHRSAIPIQSNPIFSLGQESLPSAVISECVIAQPGVTANWMSDSQ
jgi:hypothetical protein